VSWASDPGLRASRRSTAEISQIVIAVGELPEQRSDETENNKDKKRFNHKQCTMEVIMPH